ncbi:hypothetical protein DAPPUDRAFT_118811 [Daphnia pulex]|uniref:Uncharacterized protein n=1 Tax=Daphnia pulex TaxID=6669 RepID=E9HWP8_DAPPU|nr:hypothetical protein DAPPUDRAFT_118811 [Daphnia pulex]|eukprot:EFX63833.1 hypothetical protein DAPPUDRAFT_118811 [Daphnia pulex]
MAVAWTIGSFSSTVSVGKRLKYVLRPAIETYSSDSTEAGFVRLNVVAGDDVNVAVTVGRRKIFVVEDLTRTARRQWGRVSVTVGQLKDIRRSAGLQLRHSGRRRSALKDGQKGGDITGVRHRRQ